MVLGRYNSSGDGYSDSNSLFHLYLCIRVNKRCVSLGRLKTEFPRQISSFFAMAGLERAIFEELEKR